MQEKVKLNNIVPWFILMFVAMAVVNSFGLIPENISLLMKNI